jgi:hypothetical protein
MSLEYSFNCVNAQVRLFVLKIFKFKNFCQKLLEVVACVQIQIMMHYALVFCTRTYKKSTQGLNVVLISINFYIYKWMARYKQVIKSKTEFIPLNTFGITSRSIIYQ